MVANTVDLAEGFEWSGSVVRWSRFGEGSPVVLCHGTPWSSFVWRSIVDVLRPNHAVYVWDMLGYGQSDKPDGDVSLGVQGALLASLVDHWGVDVPDVIAHDVGGAVALRAHLLHDMPVRSFVLVDVVALRPWGSPFFRLVSRHADVFTELPSNLHEALIREYINGASGRGLSQSVLDELVAPWLGIGQAAFYRQIEQADEGFTAELESLYAGIDVPTLIVWGTADNWIPVDRAQRLAAEIPNSSVELIDGAGHLVQEDNPDELEAAIAGWLGQRP
jgi:pimeloyl-ACP methyl ester carboxylesterase